MFWLLLTLWILIDVGNLVIKSHPKSGNFYWDCVESWGRLK